LRRTLVLLRSIAAFTEAKIEADKSAGSLIALLLNTAYSIDYQIVYKN